MAAHSADLPSAGSDAAERTRADLHAAAYAVLYSAGTVSCAAGGTDDIPASTLRACRPGAFRANHALAILIRPERAVRSCLPFSPFAVRRLLALWG